MKLLILLPRRGANWDPPPENLSLNISVKYFGLPSVMHWQPQNVTPKTTMPIFTPAYSGMRIAVTPR